MCRNFFREQLNIIACPLPKIAETGELIEHLEALVGAKFQAVEVEGHPARLGVEGVEIDHGPHHVGATPARFSVPHEIRIVGWMEKQIMICMQCSIFSARTIDRRNGSSNAVGRVNIPTANLVLL